MKKIVVILLIVLSLLGSTLALSACNGKDKDPSNITVVVPDGAPALAIAKLLKDKPTYEGYTINYQIVAGTAEITAAMANGTASLAICPTNTAAILYNSGLAKLLSVNIHGVLYLLGTESAASLGDLKGEVVYNIGRGGTPDLTFKYILQSNNIEYVESDTAIDGKVALTYKTAPEMIPLFKAGLAKFGILGEPQVSQAIKAAGVIRLFSVQELWAEAAQTTGYPQASLIGRNGFLTEENKDFINWFIGKLEENADWIADNPEEAGQALKDNGSSVTVTLTAEAIENSNIRVVKAADSKASVNAYLQFISEFNADFVGGKLPEDDFYYIP